MGLMDDIAGMFGGGQGGQQQQPQEQQQAPQSNPLAQALMAAYFKGLTTPKLSGWGNAMGQGGMAGMEAYANTNYQNQQAKYQDALMQRATSQADLAKKKASAGDMVWMVRPKDKAAKYISSEDKATIDSLAQQGYLPISAGQTSVLFHDEEKANSGKDWKKGEFLNPEKGLNEPHGYKFGPNGEMIIGARGGPKTLEESGLQGKASEQRVQGLEAVGTSKALGANLVAALDQLDQHGDPNIAVNLLDSFFYKTMGIALPGQDVNNKVLSYTDATKQQLMSMASKSGGSRALGFIKMIDGHFPKGIDQPALKRQKAHLLFDKGGIVDQFEQTLRYGGTQQDFDVLTAKAEQQFSRIENPQAAGGSIPPPPFAIQGSPQVGPKGEIAVQSSDGNFYQFDGNQWTLTPGKTN